MPFFRKRAKVVAGADEATAQPQKSAGKGSRLGKGRAGPQTLAELQETPEARALEDAAALFAQLEKDAAAGAAVKWDPVNADALDQLSPPQQQQQQQRRTLLQRSRRPGPSEQVADAATRIRSLRSNMDAVRVAVVKEGKGEEAGDGEGGGGNSADPVAVASCLASVSRLLGALAGLVGAVARLRVAPHRDVLLLGERALRAGVFCLKTRVNTILAEMNDIYDGSVWEGTYTS